MLKCSIIIPVFDRWFYTQLCLEALSRTLAGRSDFEVVIVDNGSSDGTPAGLAALRPPYRVITNRLNLGFACACNQGAQAATGEYLVFLNNDTVPTAGWLDNLLGVAERDARVGIVGSKLLYPDGTIQHAGVAMTDELTPVHIYYAFPADYPPANVDREYQAVTGACLLTRRDLFRSVGGFDEQYVNSYEDVDLCCRVYSLGMKVVYCARSVIYHFASVSENRHDMDEANQELLLSRWKGSLKPDLRERYLADGFDDIPLRDYKTVPALQVQVEEQRRQLAALRASSRKALENLRAANRIVRERETEIGHLREQLRTLQAELTELQHHLQQVEQGKVLRALNALRSLGKRV
ncbi:MAG: glycosyltransferase [Chloroflexi bacterium]|nr:glycosyltransferase [Chloroflexota bacterium]